MKKIEMQYNYNGEWFPVWETDTKDLETAWEEIDNQPTEGGHIRFENEDEIMTVNGGF